MPSNDRTEWQKVEIPGEDSPDVYIEVLHRGGREEVGLLDSIPFEKITEIIGSIAQGVSSTLEKTKPSKASVELGIEFGLKNGQLVALIARGSGKANLKVAMEWERSTPEPR